MDHEPDRLDRATAALSIFTSIGLERAGCAAADDMSAIGYEAADPSLQEPLWHEVIRGLSNKRDWR